MARGGTDSHRDEVRVFGNTVAVLQYSAAKKNGCDTYRAVFRDAATGREHATAEVAGAVSVETWQGRPALVARCDGTVPASGTNAARHAITVTAFDENGRQIGTAEVAGGELGSQETMIDGRVVRSGPDTQGTYRIWVRPVGAPAPGTPVHTCDVRGDNSCNRPIEASGETAAFTAQTLFVTEPGGTEGLDHLRAVDPATGQTRWSTATVQAPTGAPTVDRIQGKTPERRAVVVGSAGDKVVLGWYGHEETAKYVGGPYYLGLYDAMSGRLVGSGPAPTAESVEDAALHSDASTIYLYASGFAAAWDMATGALLWQQTESERPIHVFAAANGAAYAAADASAGMDKRTQVTESVVINARTKAVLTESGPSGEGIPQVAANGYATVETPDRIWVFAPRPVT
ncbi:hypothetical protein [Streptodolium elevatio]|uniref:Serine/threonine protein kinase n=1 Tax=Streptodolium elevatio TaxID=3157996 RepID=A0ABV3DWH2_9ACTN